jgi:hypothetical protein
LHHVPAGEERRLVADEACAVGCWDREVEQAGLLLVVREARHRQRGDVVKGRQSVARHDGILREQRLCRERRRREAVRVGVEFEVEIDVRVLLRRQFERCRLMLSRRIWARTVVLSQ